MAPVQMQVQLGLRQGSKVATGHAIILPSPDPGYSPRGADVVTRPGYSAPDCDAGVLSHPQPISRTRQPTPADDHEHGDDKCALQHQHQDASV